MRKKRVLYGNKRLITLFLALVLCLAHGSVSAKADSCKIDDYNIIVDGFTPPENETIIHHISTGAKAYTKIANRVNELYVGEHHRFTAVANNRKSAKVTWASSKPEIAQINKKTGELTALAAGTTVITMWDSVNKAKQTYELTIKAKPVLPEVPREWYDVEDTSKWMLEDSQYREVQGVCLVFKPEYRYLYRQCSMMRIPDYVDGKKVIDLKNGTDDKYVYEDFNQLRALQASMYVSGHFWGKRLDMLLYSDNSEYVKGIIGKVERIPESTKMVSSSIFSNACFSENSGLSEVRIPMNVKLIYHESEYEVLWHWGGIPRGDECSFAVDGNNTNYYSIFDVLFTYPFYYELSNGRVETGRYTLMAYPKNKTGSAYRVPDGVEQIAPHAFEGARYLKKIILPDTVTRIGMEAFANMKRNVEIVIPASVTVFEEDYYSGCGPFGYCDSDMDTGAGNITIVTPKGSAAETYAKEHGIKYRNE